MALFHLSICENDDSFHYPLILQGNLKYPFANFETMNFINLPTGRGRRLVAVPAAELVGETLMAGYDSNVDATLVRKL